MHLCFPLASKRKEFICAPLKAFSLVRHFCRGNKVSICATRPSLERRNGRICDKSTEQTSRSKAGVLSLPMPCITFCFITLCKHKPF